MPLKRIRIIIQGLVQGVGFRPTLARLAAQHQVTGFIKNTGFGVEIEAQGEATDTFVKAIPKTKPTHAEIKSLQTENISLVPEEKHFSIKKSKASYIQTQIAPDLAICEDCLKELFDKNSRYYLYPFIACTHCGPRHSMVTTLPYDRANTAMHAFTLCDECEKCYRCPNDRRFHAEATACAVCGPQYTHSLQKIVSALVNQKIVAIKGIGGYQLFALAEKAQTIQTLRQRKKRPHKPFALMALNLKSIDHWIGATNSTEEVLTSPARPIVILPNTQNKLFNVIAPGLNQCGVMLPSTPLHTLLFYYLLNQPQGFDWMFDEIAPLLICTSGNVSGNPIIYDNQSAKEELSICADLIVSHNREIINPSDDSVVFKSGLPIRRARGVVPKPILLKQSMPPVLALGGELKNTVCFIKDNEAYVSQHIGSLANPKTREWFQQTVDAFLTIFDCTPEIIAHDCHPDFYSTRVAETLSTPLMSVQHHHAHAASVMAENHLDEPVLALVLDGYGYGADKTAWGGECLKVSGVTCERLGHLAPMRLLGGEKAHTTPWRMALSLLDEMQSLTVAKKRFSHLPLFEENLAILARIKSIPMTTSCGRLFDAASALLGICVDTQTYEGQAAMQLESLVAKTTVHVLGYQIKQNILDFKPLFKALLSEDIQSGANLFHGTLIAGFTEWLYGMAKETGIQKCVLAGGCMQNQVLRKGLIQSLTEKGVTVYTNKRVPCNDGGLSLGQAFVAGLHLLARGI